MNSVKTRFAGCSCQPFRKIRNVNAFSHNEKKKKKDIKVCFKGVVHSNVATVDTLNAFKLWGGKMSSCVVWKNV